MKLTLNSLHKTALAGLALALLASCGGGTQIEQFAPERIVVFGDEASLIVTSTAPEGLKYTINGVDRDTDGTTLLNVRKCARNPIWVQLVATNYGFQFPECATTAGLPTNGVMRAQLNSTVAMMTAQITSYSVSPGFTGKDLVTVMVGTHDIVAALGSADPLAAASAAGTAVGQQVVTITDRGAKVIVSTIPDVGTTPYGVSLGATQAALLSQMTAAFNTSLRLKLQEVRGGGHSAGLVLGDELVLVMHRYPATYGINATVPEALTQAACTTTLPDCDERDTYLSTQAVATLSHGYDWLWAGPLQMGPNAQSRLGVLAASRARSNPF